ncbi:MAG: thiamine ABC transporter substrate-binding protein [Anaerolineaceae bacterium]|jgi:thiamine transport system substrate-binding protein
MIRKFLPALLALALLLSACRVSPSPAPLPSVDTPESEPKTPETLTVITHDSFAVSGSLIADFEKANNAKIAFIKGGDAGGTLNRLILTSLSGSHQADVFYGLDNTFLSRALEQDLFETYAPVGLENVAAEFKMDPNNGATPIDYGDVCINYDKAYFEDNELPLPENLVQLRDPVYVGKLAVINPATSSPGLAFMLATIAAFGEDGWLDWWGAMKENEVVVAPDWETAYYTNFSGSSGKGPQPMVVSYASSPAAELMFSDPRLEESPTASLVFENACWRQVEFAGILKGTAHRALAEKFMDFLLSKAFQEDVPGQMFVYPVLPGANLPADYVTASQIPEKPASLDPALIAANREAWVQAWTDLMLK